MADREVAVATDTPLRQPGSAEEGLTSMSAGPTSATAGNTTASQAQADRSLISRFRNCSVTSPRLRIVGARPVTLVVADGRELGLDHDRAARLQVPPHRFPQRKDRLARLDAAPGGATDPRPLGGPGVECAVIGIVRIYSDPRHVILYTSKGEVRQEFRIVLAVSASLSSYHTGRHRPLPSGPGTQ